MIRRSGFFGILLLAAAAPAAAVYQIGDTLPEPLPVPALNDVNVAVLQRAVGASLACGAEFLQWQIRDFTNGWTWVVPPRDKVVGHREKITIERRCSSTIIDVPDFEEKWEKYYTIVPVQTDSASAQPKLRRVEGRRLVSRRQIGSHQETTLVADPNGSIVRTIELPAGPILGDLWPPGFLGQNAMVLDALVKAGIPESDPKLARLAHSLKRAVEEYGVPDVTWDVAWLAAAFCALRDSADYVNVRRRVVNRLLDGQITEGAGRGLWGPVCVNMRLLAAFMAYDQSLEREHERLKVLADARPQMRSYAGKAQTVESLQERIFAIYAEISQHGCRFDKVTQDFRLDDGLDEGAIRETWTAGVPYFFYNQSLADMDSTALALFAIREAAEAGCLPDETVHPKLDEKVLLPPEKTGAILARAANAIASHQAKDGTWSAGKIHEKSAVFSALHAAPVFDPGIFRMESPTNFLTTAQAFAALLDAGRAAGFGKLQPRFTPNLDLGRKAQLAAVAGYLANRESCVVPIQGNLAPLELLFQFSRVHRPADGVEDSRRDLWARLARRAMDLQAPDGSWGDGLVMLYSTSAWDYLDNWGRVWFERYDDKGADRKARYNSLYYWQNNGYWRKVDARLACTSWAMLFLLEGVRPPVAGYLARPSEAGSAAALEKAVEFVRKETFMQTRLTPVSPSSAGLADALPLLCLSSADTLSDTNAQAIVKRLLANGGTAVFLGATNAAAAGLSALLPLVPKGKWAPVPAAASFYGTYRGKAKPALSGLLREDGRAAVLLLPWTPSASAQAATGTLTYAEAVLTLAALIEDHCARTRVCARDYPTRMDGLTDPFAERVNLLNAMSSRPAGLAADETWGAHEGTSTQKTAGADEGWK